MSNIEDIINGKIQPKYNPRYVTFSRNVFLPVTNVCRNACSYCGFRHPVDSNEACLMTVDEVRTLLTRAAEHKATEALFTLGEYPDVYPAFRTWLKEMGYNSMVDYIVELCQMALDMGLLPHSNLGVLSYEELGKLKPVNASIGLMLETTANIDAHKHSPGKDPELRLRTIEDAGSLNIPFTTGILVGIGETWEDRIESLQAIKELHQHFDHIQEVIVQSFIPKVGTPMEGVPAPDMDEMCKTVALAREILPEEVIAQAPPNLVFSKQLIQAGAGDLGGISEVTVDYINPEHGWPSIDDIRKKMHPIELKERLPIYPRFVEAGWHSDLVGKVIKQKLDVIGYRDWS